MDQSIAPSTSKPPRIVGILQSNSGAKTLTLHSFLAVAQGWEKTKNLRLHTSIPGVCSQWTMGRINLFYSKLQHSEL